MKAVNILIALCVAALIIIGVVAAANQPSDEVFAPDAKIAWGLGGEVNELNQPCPAIEAQRKYGALDAFFLFDNEEICLTFDLGYENGYTAPILDALGSCGVKAVFFVTMDYVDEAPELVKRIIDEGHVLANHTVKHPSMPSVSEQRAADEVMNLHDYIKQEYGYEMEWFRFPCGEFSVDTLKLVQSLGYKSMFWSFAYVDWLTADQPNPEAALKKLVNAAHPGAIYLLHAVSSTNAAIMEDFITALMEQGYDFYIPGQSEIEEGIL